MKLFEKIHGNHLSADEAQKEIEIEMIVTDALLYNVYARFMGSMTESEWACIAKALTCVRIVQTHPELMQEYRAKEKEEETRLKEAMQPERDVA